MEVAVKILVAIILAALLYWFFILRPGRLDFWKVAGKYPDLAYDFFCSRDCWKVFEHGLPGNYREVVPHDEWAGPFRLSVPKLGNKMIHIFGRARDYEDSQNDFLQKTKSTAGGLL
jgi:hypothetical protein